jgi:hypothetical protein
LNLIGVDIGAEGEPFGHAPKQDLRKNHLVLGVGPPHKDSDRTLPSSEPDAIRSSLKGFLGMLASDYGDPVNM